MSLKVGIIGYGYMGVIRHRTVDARSDLELTIVCDTNPDTLREQKGFKVVRDPNEVINSDVDIVFVCTPNHLIPKLAIAALERGKHVFAEKPPGRCLEDILAIREQEKLSQNAKLMFGFNHRYHPAMLRAKAMISSGRFGRPLWVRGVYGKSGGRNFQSSWRNKRDISGGGILLDQGIHMIDLFNYLLGPFDKVKALTTNNFWDVEVEDNAFVIMSNSQNVQASLHSCATLWKHTFQLKVGLEKAYLEIEGFLSKTGSYGREMLKIGHRQFEDESEALGNPAEEVIYFDRDRSWDIELEKFIGFISNDKKVDESSSEDAMNAMRVVDLAYKDSGCFSRS